MGKQPMEIGSGRDSGVKAVSAPRIPSAPPITPHWAQFLEALSTAAYAEPDPLLPQAMKYHPRFHMYLRDEDDRLCLLQAECLRLCAGDEAHAKRLAADVVWACFR